MSANTIQVISFAIGAFSGSVSILGLWSLVYYISRKFEPNLKPPFPHTVMILALILKLPAIIYGWQYARSLGTTAYQSFGLGFVLVYCLAVVGIALRRQEN